MTDITINRWQKYGNDRAYATRADGTRLGYVDLATGNTHPVPGQDAEFLSLTVRAWCERNGIILAQVQPSPGASLAGITVPSFAPLPLETAELTVDLSQNRPGAAVRQRAQEEWSAYNARRPIASQVARFLHMNTPDRLWLRGAQGEEVVGGRLESLVPEGWRVLHAVPVGTRGSDIDHVLIGPPGVFCINTKNRITSNVWIGERMIMVNGQKTDYLRNSRFEAQRASKILTKATGWKIDVTPAIVIMAKKFTVKNQPKDVSVLRRMDVPQWFRRQQATMSDEAVLTIFERARNPAIWTG